MNRRHLIIVIVLLLLGALAVVPALAQSGAVWNVSFYNNQFLIDPVVHSRQDARIAFNWGTGSPAPGVNADNFSARWGTDVFLPAGTYRFWALADDNVRVTINFNNTIIDTFARPAVGQTVSADVSLNAGTHHIQVDYREAGGEAYVYVDWANLTLGQTGPNFGPAPQPPVPAPITGTWTGQYFANRDLAGTPFAIRTDSSPNFNWGAGAPIPGMPADNFSVRWTSTQALTGGTYRITTRSDDGIRVYVNGQLVINQWQDATGQTYTADLNLPAGQHTFVVEYYEAFGDAFIQFSLAQISGPFQPAPLPIQPAPVPGGNWIAYYYANRDLAGTPFAIRTEASPNYNWGAGAPIPGMPADNFSVRWTSTQNLSAGTYRITTRADDGVRVYVNGQLVINQWNLATGQTYTADVTLGTGQHTFVVEYFEAGGVAFIEFSIAPVGIQPPAPPAQTGVSATVTAFRLNVRDQPTTSGSQILTRINRGETYPVLGRTDNNAWLQLNVNGTIGWAYASFLDTTPGNIPVTGTSPSTPAPASTGFSLAALSDVNIRSGPSPSNAILGVLRIGRTAQILGRNADNTWWQVNHNGIVGWVSGRFIQLQAGADVGRIPITG